VKAGFVSLIGRPNAGKSTLLNRLVGQKVAIVSDKPQTTRHRIIGVRHTASAQMVFIDTPGIHKPVHRMNRLMVDAALDTLRDVDVVVLVVDASIRSGPGDRFVLDLLSRRAVKPILALNKIDRVDKPRLLPMLDRYTKEAAFLAMVPICLIIEPRLPSTLGRCDSRSTRMEAKIFVTCRDGDASCHSSITTAVVYGSSSRV